MPVAVSDGQTTPCPHCQAVWWSDPYKPSTKSNTIVQCLRCKELAVYTERKAADTPRTGRNLPVDAPTARKGYVPARETSTGPQHHTVLADRLLPKGYVPVKERTR